MTKTEKCQICGKDKKDVHLHRTSKKRICKWCYQKHHWTPKLRKCVRCDRMMPNLYQGRYCKGCYNTLFRLDYEKARQVKRLFDLDYETYSKLTKKCASCGFTKVVQLHHLDLNKKNNNPNNFAPLCPNCHSMIHNLKFYKEIRKNLRKKGYKLPKQITKLLALKDN